jgi:ABC-type amino acid transport substrate-binding protein
MKWKFIFLSLLLIAVFSINPFAAQKATLVTLDWEPYIGQSLAGKGYVFEIVTAAFKKAGYEVEINFYPWERSLRMAQTGQVDGLFPEYYDSRRLPDFIYSKAFPGGPVGLYARKDSNIKFTMNPGRNQTAALKALDKYRFGVVRGYINTKEFDNASFLQKEAADSDETNLRKLYAKRIDLIFIDKFVAQYIIKTKLPQFGNELVFLEPPLEVKPLYIVFSKKSPAYQQKLKAFNRGLQQIEKDGTLKGIMRKYGF